MNRREFIKVAGFATAATGAALVTKPKEVVAVDLGKEQDEFPYVVTEDYKGFSSANTMFMRAIWDNEPYEDDYIQKTFNFRTPAESGTSSIAVKFGMGKPKNDPKKLGYREIDMALAMASASTDMTYTGLSKNGQPSSPIQLNPIDPKTGKKIKSELVAVEGMYYWDNSTVKARETQGKHPYKFNDAKEAAKYVKRAAKFLGADLVGVTPYNERTKRWTYKEIGLPITKPFNLPDGSVKMLPFDPMKLRSGKVETFGLKTEKLDLEKKAGFVPKSIIVLAFEMDYDAFKAAPTHIGNTGANLGYSRMAETSHKLANFLKNIGYRAAQCGNDTALSIPLAVEAGLGEGSRMGIIVTQKYGPRVRLAKLYTDLEIHPDKPVKFGVKEFCDVCMKCADGCPGNAISKEPITIVKEGMEFDTGKVSKSNVTGIEKWFVNGARCHAFWNYSGVNCGTCISVCPYNKIDEWHHDLTKLMTLTPFKPLLRDLDEWFGYGGPLSPNERAESKYLQDAVNDFWDKI